MKANKFVVELEKLTPSIQLMKERGYREKSVIREIQCYKAIPKVEFFEFENELLNLVYNYDASTLEIGYVTFGLGYSDMPTETDTFWRVGCVEADFLIVDKNNGNIRVEDHASEGFIIWDCAKNSEKFLDAIYEVAKFQAKWFEINEDSGIYECDRAKFCSKIAGGIKYLNFYKMLFGCDH